MADPRSESDTGGDTGTPRWVKMFGTIFVIVVLLFFLLLFTRGAHRGPGDHISSGGTDRHAPDRARQR